MVDGYLNCSSMGLFHIVFCDMLYISFCVHVLVCWLYIKGWHCLGIELVHILIDSDKQFCSVCTSVYSQQQNMAVSLLCQNLELPVPLIFSILIGMYWYCTVILIYISLMTKPPLFKKKFLHRRVTLLLSSSYGWNRFNLIRD